MELYLLYALDVYSSRAYNIGIFDTWDKADTGYKEWLAQQNEGKFYVPQIERMDMNQIRL